MSTESTLWARTAAWTDGVNINTAPHDTERATRAQRQDVFRRINHVDKTILGMPRGEVTRNPDRIDEQMRQDARETIDRRFDVVQRDGSRIDQLMLYDERQNGILYTWTETELRVMREELDATGRQDVDIIWRATNNARRNSDFAALPFIDGLLIEGSADRFINNRFNVNVLAESFWNRSSNSDKPLYLQIPRSENSMTQYEATRRAVLEMSNVLGVEAVRSDRLVIVPVTYGETYQYLPETTGNGSSYTNTLMSTTLSLIEQRPYFEGRLGELPSNFAASLERFELEASIASSADGSLRRNKGNNAVDGQGLGFIVNNENLEVGQTGSAPYDRAAVIPFQLPNLGNVEDPFLQAYFEGFLTQTATADGVTADFYGIDRRETPEILNGDYYGLSGSPDPDATLLQEDILMQDMDIDSPFYSNAGGNENLIDFLNEQYAGGEGAGDYIFLRINTSGNTNQRWALASGNTGDASKRPQLRYTALSSFPGDVDGDGDIDDTDLGVAISNFTGPNGSGKTLAQGDVDGDGDVDDTDLGVAISGFTGPLSPTNVPEPTSLALLGLAGMILTRRRR